MRTIRTTKQLIISFMLSSLISFFAVAQELHTKVEQTELNTTTLSCEVNLLYQDLVVNEAIEVTKDGSLLIVIVRPGINEKSPELNRRRLHNVRRYFSERGSRLESERVLIVQGDRVEGYGRLEYYLRGKLYQQLLFPKNGYICHSCCGPDEGYYPLKTGHVRKKILRKRK